MANKAEDEQQPRVFQPRSGPCEDTRIVPCRRRGTMLAIWGGPTMGAESGWISAERLQAGKIMSKIKATSVHATAVEAAAVFLWQDREGT